MKTFTTDWKRSYWPEPRLGRAETRNDVLRRLGKIAPKRSRLTADVALQALSRLVGANVGR